MNSLLERVHSFLRSICGRFRKERTDARLESFKTRVNKCLQMRVGELAEKGGVSPVFLIASLREGGELSVLETQINLTDGKTAFDLMRYACSNRAAPAAEMVALIMPVRAESSRNPSPSREIIAVVHTKKNYSHVKRIQYEKSQENFWVGDMGWEEIESSELRGGLTNPFMDEKSSWMKKFLTWMKKFLTFILAAYILHPRNGE